MYLKTREKKIFLVLEELPDYYIVKDATGVENEIDKPRVVCLSDKLLPLLELVR